MIKIKPTKEVDKSPKNGPVIKKKGIKYNKIYFNSLTKKKNFINFTFLFSSTFEPYLQPKK